MREDAKALQITKEYRRGLLSGEECEAIQEGVEARRREEVLDGCARNLLPARGADGRLLPQEIWVCLLCDPERELESREAFFDHGEEAHGDFRTLAAYSAHVSHWEYPGADVWYTQWRLADHRRLADSYTIRPRRG